MIKLRDETKIPKKVMFLGKDGTGKSTAAYKYCQNNNLKPIAIDFDDTNIGTGCPVMEIRLTNHTASKKAILNAIDEVEKSPDYDTIILDNVGTMGDDVSAPRETDPFGNSRTDAIKAILNKLKKSRLNVILIAQIDFYVDDPVDSKKEKNNKKSVALNAWVNEKYYCYKTGTSPNFQYHCDVDKKREVKTTS